MLNQDSRPIWRDRGRPVLNRAVIFRMARGALVLSCAFATGCAWMHREQAQEPVSTAPAAVSVPVEVPAAAAPPEAATAAPAAVVAPEKAETAVQSPVIEPVSPTAPVVVPRAVAPKTPAASPPVTKAAAPRPPAAIAPTQPPAPKAAPKVAAATSVAPPPAAPLDFKSLGTRLRQTRAIGVMTKLSLKNQADDLLVAFRAYHNGQGKATLAELRRSYDMLLMKVLSLLQDGDPTLAKDIVQSRAAIWGILSDPRKFTDSNLMAGATP
jgi:hypothetical protein